jgi:hypothetical protein
MSWPLSQDYNEAIQAPVSNFADPDLKRGRATANAFGVPMPCSGNFADVYQLSGPDGTRWAVKCFTRETPGLRERYAAISSHLRQVQLRCTVNFEYLEQGIRVGCRWFPVLKMEWVGGLPLNQFVAQAADRPATLDALVHRWAKLARHLRAAEVAHGDLQHGNVLLVPAPAADALSLKLVDYDGMWVPALAGQKSGEVGHPSYQHPGRAQVDAYGPDTDRFSLLLGATALCAVRVSGLSLWQKYDNGDNLLFTQEDLEAPARSRLFYDLLKSSDSGVRILADRLIEALRGPVHQVPRLEDVLPEFKSARSSRGATSIHVAVTARPPSSTTGESSEGSEPEVELFDRWRAAGPTELAAPQARGGLAGLIALALVLAVVAGGVGAAYFLSQGGREKPPRPRLADNRPLDAGRITTSLVPDGSAPRKGALSFTGRAGPAPLVSLPSLIDPDPQGAVGEVRRFDGHTAEIRRLAVSPDGRQLLTAGWDRTFRLWDIATGRELVKWTGEHNGAKMHGVAFLPDGRRALSCCSEDLLVRLCDLTDGHTIRTYRGHSQGVWHVVVSRDGRLAASCGSESTVFLWDVETGALLRRLQGHVSGVEIVSLSNDGKVLLTGSMRGPVDLWNLAGATPWRRYLGTHMGYVMGVQLSPDGQFALSGSNGDKTTRI